MGVTVSSHASNPSMRDRAEFLLRPDEIRRLTGYEIQPKQRAELERMKIPYIVNARGHLCVSRAAAERRLGVDSVSAQTSDEPDFSAFQT